MTPFHERSVGGRRSSRAAVTAAATLVAAATLGAPVRAQHTLSRISGRVIDETGAPIAGAVVRADSRGDSPGAFTTTTSEKGEFAILGLRRGLWTITVTASGFEPVESNLPLGTARNLPSMRITLRQARTRGARSPLAAVDVEALQARLDEAEAFATDGRLDEALAIYQQAVEDVPALTSIHRRIGDLYVRKKDRSRALDAYERLLDASPDDEAAAAAVAGVAVELGLEAEAAGDREAAIRHLERALAAAPDGPRAADARAALARLRGA